MRTSIVPTRIWTRTAPSNLCSRRGTASGSCEPGPQAFDRVGMHLTHAIAIIVAGIFGLGRECLTLTRLRPVKGSRSYATHSSVLTVHLSAVNDTTSGCRRVARYAAGLPPDGPWLPSRPTTPSTGERSRFQVPWPLTLLVRPPRRSAGSVCSCLFSPRFGTSHRPRPPCQATALGAVPQPPRLAFCAAIPAGSPSGPARGHRGRWFHLGRSRGETAPVQRDGDASCGASSQ